MRGRWRRSFFLKKEPIINFKIICFYKNYTRSNPSFMILQKKKKRGANCRNRSTQQGRGGARAKARKPPHRFRRPITSYSEPPNCALGF